jgi:OOP family OmpA-OmpF porin
MNRTSLVICLAVSLVATVGCSSKNYVKSQTTPLINKTNELDDLTAKNTRDIKDVDARAQAGIQAVNAKTDQVEQKAQSAAQNAGQAQQMADAANGRVGVLTNTVANLDNYHAVAETSVKFGFNKGERGARSACYQHRIDQGLHHRFGRRHGFGGTG